MAKTNEAVVKDSKVGITAHIITALLFLAMGIALLVTNAAFIYNLVYTCLVAAAGILLIIFGAFFMIKYFFSQEFKRVTNYSFTQGVILIIIGALIIFKADSLSNFIDAIVCLAGAVLGAVMLQQSFALFHLKRKTWILILIFGLAAIASSLFFFVNGMQLFTGNVLAAIYLTVLGALSLLSLILMAIGLLTGKKQEKKNTANNVAEGQKTESEDSFFEDDTKTVVDGVEYTSYQPENTSSDSSTETKSDTDALFED